MGNPYHLASIDPDEISQRAHALIDEITTQRFHAAPLLTHMTKAELLHFSRENTKEMPVLHNVEFAGEDLRGINLSAFAFDNVHFARTRLSRKELETLIPYAKEGKISLKEVYLQGADLSGKVLNRADIGLVKLIRLSLEGLDLRGANFRDANLDHIDLDQANLQGANFEGASLKKALIRKCNLINADMLGVNLTEAQLEGSDMRGADLRNANITDTNFTGVKL